MKLITVFTPTYNRENKLSRCYESLVMQTSKNFVWQVIDDGSTDNTEQLIQSFITEGKIEISYVKKTNGGKVSAVNRSLDITNTALWVCLDSDDYFFPEAIEIYEKMYQQIKNKPDICGLISVRSNPDSTPMMGMNMPNNLTYETQFNLRYRYKVEPEYVQVYKTKVVNQYKYPLFEGEKYVPLSYVQDQIDQKYRFYVFYEPTMVCEYQSDGITKNQKKLVKKNPNGYMAFKRQQIEIAPDFFFKLKACITYDTGCILSGKLKGVFGSPCPILTLLCFPLGLMDYLVRYKKI